MTPDRDPLLTAALYYAERGWPTFPLGRSKRPVANCADCRTADPSHDPCACSCLCCHGFHAATADPDRIAAMRKTHPKGLLAVRTGAASGLVVVDIDPRNGGALDSDLMPPTATVVTGGGGWHLYYRYPGNGQTISSRGLPGHPGVDIKADGGYVAAPPSIHPGTKIPYRWVGGRAMEEMPPPLLALCRNTPAVPGLSTGILTPPLAASPAPTPTPLARGRGISFPDKLLAAHLSSVILAPEGRRRATLYGAARGVARMVAVEAITRPEAIAALTDTGRAAGQTDRDIRAAITGGFRDEGIAA